MNSRAYKYSRSLLINILERGGVTFIEHGFLLIITTDASNGCKLCMLRSNVLYFRLLKTADLERRVKRRLEQQRSRSVTDSMSLLVSHEGEKVWGEKRIGNKVDMVAQIVGFKHRMNNGRDQICMQRYAGSPSLAWTCLQCSTWSSSCQLMLLSLITMMILRELTS